MLGIFMVMFTILIVPKFWWGTIAPAASLNPESVLILDQMLYRYNLMYSSGRGQLTTNADRLTSAKR